MLCDNNIETQQAAVSLMAACGADVEVRLATTSFPPCPPLSRYLIKLDCIAFDGAALELKAPIEVALYREDQVWYCENDDFSILAFGDTAQEAAHSFCEDFVVLWEEIGQAPNDSLTQEAQKVKQNFIYAVKSPLIR